MTNPVGWECGKCGLVLAPHVDSHRCDPPEGGTGGRLVAAPGGGGGGGGQWAWLQKEGSGISVTTGGAYSSTGTRTGGGSGGYTSPPGVASVRVTEANASLRLVPDEVA